RRDDRRPRLPLGNLPGRPPLLRAQSANPLRERRMSTVALPATAEARTARRETLGQLVRSPTFLTGVLIVGFWVFCALFGSSIAPHDPQDQSFTPLVKPGGGHPFGTDSLGRDVLSRVLVGAGDILKVAPLATLLGIAGGTVVGLVTGYFRG